MTIRRDLGVLAAQQLVEKIHGGPCWPRAARPSPTSPTRRRISAAAKAAIAEAAVAMVRDGRTVGLSAGTTTWQVARRLRGGVHDLTFVTNSLNVAGVLEANGWHSIVVSGGSFRTPSDALVARSPTRSCASQRRPAGAGRALDRRQGGADHPQHRRGRDQPDHGRRRPACGRGGRLEQARAGLAATFAGIDDVDELITDSEADRAMLEALGQAGLLIQLVEPQSLQRPAEVTAS